MDRETRPGLTARQLLVGVFEAAIAGAMPDRATEHAVAEVVRGRRIRVWMIGLGKAAAAMTAAACRAVTEAGGEIAGGLVVGPATGTAPHVLLLALSGNHPIPGRQSFAAAAAVGDLIARMAPGDVVFVLLSGGATALVAAPMPGVAQRDLAALYELLLASGLDIVDMNVVRKRFSRWGGGKLAVALAPREVHCLVVSDVPGDDVASIGSGPCVPDPRTAREIAALLAAAQLTDRLPPTVRRYLDAAIAGAVPETPKPGDPRLVGVRTTVIVSNRVALAAAARRAAAFGIAAEVRAEPLVGEAATAGHALADELVARGPGGPALVVWGGETTVTLGDTAGRGGRCQELALAAAETLDAAARRGGCPVTLLAAGTDGRDGPTDAAGAVVDASTWGRIGAAGGDPARALRGHAAYDALDVADALVKRGLTGTNVMDIVLGYIA